MPCSKAPVAVFAYNRLGNFKKMFASLRDCSGFEQSPVTVFLDGAKSEADRGKVDAVRDYANGINLPNVTVVCRDTNQGLKQSIFDGATRLCQEHGRVIVLEDDLILSPIILDYFNTALDLYEQDERVWSVIGYQYDVPQLKEIDRALLLPFTHSWGWATWDRCWSRFDITDQIREEDLHSETFAAFFNLMGVRDFSNMLHLSQAGLIDSWFIPWYYKVFSERGVSVFPPRSLLRNIGMAGKGGSHASSLNPYNLLVKSAALDHTLCRFPDRFQVDYWALDGIRRSWDARVQKGISCCGRIKRKLLSSR